MADRLGIHPGDAIGANCYEWCHGTDRPIDVCPLRDSISDGREHSAEIIEPKLGGTFIVSVSPLKTDSGEPPEMFVHVARDITERKIFEEQLQELAITDSLTRVWNRRHFMHLVERELDRAKRYGGPLAILLIDLDHFKKINDTYGHDVGDEALKRVAEVSMTTLRRVDIFARYGGEEFAVAMPQTNLEHAVRAAERLRQSVAETPMVAHGSPLFITVSIGVTVAGSLSADLSTVLKRADIALYQAKSNGRNRVEVFSQP
jgi:diguanylate cyclase (GGDEF)-like protein